MGENIKRLLVIRLSALGDVILTSPVLEALQKYLPDTEIHYLVKETYAAAIKNNPRVTQLHLLNDNEEDLHAKFAELDFKAVIDLQRNSVSKRIKKKINSEKTLTVDKRNIDKFQMTLLKRKIEIPHIVSRYLDVLRPLGIPVEANEFKLEFHIPDEYLQTASVLLFNSPYTSLEPTKTDSTIHAQTLEWTALEWTALVLGGSYRTKQWMPDLWAKLIQKINGPVILLGGKGDSEYADLVLKELASFPYPIFDAVGKQDFMISAALLAHSVRVVSHDTGLMHVAAALQKPTVALWGNTTPEIGMSPWQTPHFNAEVKGLWCRPCSKLGFERCPLGHFNCMKKLTPETVFQALESLRPLNR